MIDKHFPTDVYHWCYRFGFNLFPCYWGTGAKVTHIGKGFREMIVKLPLTWRTKNYFGTLFGGSLYAATDPMYMLMLHKCLGREYVVWDKSAAIKFRRPGRAAVYAHFWLTDDDLAEIKSAVAANQSLDRTFIVELKDAEENLICVIEKVIYVAEKSHYQQKLDAHASK